MLGFPPGALFADEFAAAKHPDEDRDAAPNPTALRKSRRVNATWLIFFHIWYLGMN
jgi:hypothetical protein